MSMFEVRVSAHTKHAHHVHVSQKVGTYEVSAILLQKYEGSVHAEVLKRDFYFMRNGTEELNAMWLQGVPREQPPEPSGQPSSIPVEDPGSAGQDDRASSESGEEFVEDIPALDPERVRLPEEEQAIKTFIDEAKALAVVRRKPEPVLLARYTHRTPFQLPAGDNRFDRRQKFRIFACDGCGMLVGLSRASLGTGGRFWGDFLGAYSDHSWKDIPAELQEEAWNLGLIDASWKCWSYCGGEITGAHQDRTSRPANYRAEGKRPRDWR